MRGANDVLIIGGGLSGLLVARELAVAGINCRVIERGAIGREASWAGGGILSPLYPWRYEPAVTMLARTSQAMYPQLCEQLRDAVGIDPEFTRSGMLVLDSQDFAEANEWAARNACRLEQWKCENVARREPELHAPEGGVWLPDVAQLRNPRLLQALAADLKRRGVALVEGQAVTTLAIDGDRVTGVKTAQGAWYADAVVITAGAWSKDVLKAARIELDVFPVKGQMLLYKTELPLLRSIVVSRGHYMVPRRDGHVLVGSTMEQSGFDKSTTDAARNELIAAAVEMMPAFDRLQPIRQWAGLRPGSPRGIPFIGPVAGLNRLFVNAGHFRNGVVMGPAAARLAVDWLLERETVVDGTPYLPAPSNAR